MVCPVCHTQGNGKFCAECGNPLFTERLTMRRFFEGSLSALLLIERRYARTIHDFYRNAFQTVIDFSGVKRKYYAPPIVFFFFMASLLLLTKNLFFGEDLRNDVFDVHFKTGEGESIPLGAMMMIERINRSAELVIHLSRHYTNYFDLGIPVVYGLIFYLFFRKRFNLAESFSFSFFLLALAIKLPALCLLPIANDEVRGFLQIGAVMGITAWVFSSMPGKKWLQILKGVVTYFISVIVYIVSWIFLVYLFHPFLI